MAPKRRNRRRIVLGAVGGALLLALLLLAAPMLAGRLGRGYAERALGGAIPGSVRVSGLSLSWWGPQRARGVSVLDPGGVTAATVDVEVSAGLLGLAMGRYDLGTVEVSGRADVIAGADGVTNLERALGAGRAAPPGGGSGAGASTAATLPPSLAATLILDALDIVYTDVRLPAGPLSLGPVDGRCELRVGAPITGSLRSMAEVGAAPAGTIEASWTIGGLTDADGRVTLAAMTIEAKASVTDLSLTLMDSVADQGGRLEALLGPMATVALAVNGAVADLGVEIAASSPLARADLGLRITPDTVEATRIGTVEADARGLTALAPGVFASEPARGRIVIDEWPRAHVTIESLRVPLGAGKPVLGQVAAQMALSAGQAVGRVGVGEDGKERVVAVSTKPLTGRLATAALKDGVRLTLANGVVVDGHEAGAFAVDLTAADFVSAADEIDLGRAVVDGVASLAGFDTRAVQPFVEGLGLRLAEDVGPTVDLELTAAAQMAGAEAMPETTVELRVRSKNLALTAQAAVAKGVVRSTGDGVTVAMVDAGPLAMRLVDGVRVDGPMAAGLTATVARADLSRLARDGGMDLRGAGGSMNLTAGPMAGTLDLAGKPLVLRAVSIDFGADTQNLAQGINVRTKSRGVVGGGAEAAVEGTVAVGGVLDAAGGVRMPPGPLRGRIAARGIPMAVVQTLAPRLAAAGIDLPVDVGPSADMVAVLAPGAEEGATEVDLTVRSPKVQGSGVLVWNGAEVRTGGNPLSITVASPGPVMTRWLSGGVSMAPGGEVALVVDGLALPVRPEFAPLAATGRVRATVRGLAATKEGAASIAVESASATLEVRNTEAPRMSVKSNLSQAGRAFSIDADVVLDGVLSGVGAARGLSFSGIKPLGTIMITDAPMSLADWAGQKPGGDEADWRSLLPEWIGPTASLSVTMKGTAAGTSVAANAKSAYADAALNGLVSDGTIEIGSFSGGIAVTPAGVGAAMAFGGVADGPRLRAPARLTLGTEPVTIRRDAAGVPDLASAGVVKWSGAVEGKVQIDGLDDPSSAEGRMGPIGLGDVRLSGAVPIGAVAGGTAGELSARVDAGLIGGPTAGPQRLEATTTARVQGAAARGPVRALVKVKGLDARWADLVAARPGLVSGLVGGALDVEVGFEGVAVAAGDATTIGEGRVTALASSPSVEMSGPAVIAIDTDRLSLTKPITIHATVPAAWGNDMLFGADDAMEGPPAPRAASLAGPVAIRVGVPSLVVARGEGPMKPGVFAARVVVDAPSIPMTIGDGKAEFTKFHAEATGGQKPGVVGFSLNALDSAAEIAAKAAAPPEPIRLAGGLYGVCDEAGRPTPGAILMTATGKAVKMSTAVIDAIGRQEGLILELLGPTVSLDIELGGFGRESGKISAKAVSPRANASLTGVIRGGVLKASGPVRAEVLQVTPQLGARLVKGLPLVGAFEKRPEDGPGVLTVANLEAPLNGDWSLLNGDINMDFGVARFATGPGFSAILRAVGSKDGGTIGRRLGPLALTARKGVVSYKRYRLPLGEFNVDTEGWVDIANRRLDVVTYIPIGALTDEAAGMFNTGLGRLLGGAVPLIEKATMVPWRTKGPMESPRTMPELGLFAQNLGQTILSPGAGLFKGLQDLFGGGPKGGGSGGDPSGK